MPAINGYGIARSVGAVQSVLACGGVRLLSQAGCERVFEEQYRGVDRVLGMPIRWGMGVPARDRPAAATEFISWWAYEAVRDGVVAGQDGGRVVGARTAASW
jgi:hypothetical protein